MRLVAVNGADSTSSKTRALVAAAVDDIIDLCELPADGLLGRTADEAVAAAVTKASEADVLVVATPIYRATYTGAVKAFFDRFPMQALQDTAVVLVATAIAPEHFLALDTGGRALIASLGGLTVPKVVYATHGDFVDGAPTPAIVDELKAAIEQAERLS